jgi:hypothetical protein
VRNAARDGEVERPAVYPGLSAGYDPGDHWCNSECSFGQAAKCDSASLLRAEFNWKPAVRRWGCGHRAFCTNIRLYSILGST